MTSTIYGTGRGVGRGRWWALGALVLSGLVIGIDTTVLITALPTLSTRLGATTSELQWISDGYTLALAGLLLPAGLLGDRFGRRRLLLTGLLLFGLASVVASRVTTAGGLIAMRAVMGAGAAIVLPLSVSILPSMFSSRERPRAVAIATAGAMLGLPLGPLTAGWLLSHFDWGSIFLINAPIVLLGLLGVWLFVPESRDPRARALDWPGALLALTGVTGLVYGVIEEPANGWGDARVLAGLIGGALLLAGFAIRELSARSPLVDLRLFGNPRFAWSTIAFALVGFAMVGVLFALTPYLQIVQGTDALGTGVRLLPMIAALIVAALPSDRLTARLGTKLMVASGLLATAAGLVVLSRAGADTGYGLVAVSLAAIGVGMGLAMPPALDAILGSLPPAQMGAGNGLTRTLQNVGASFGVAILGSILSQVYRSSLDPHLTGLPAQVQDAARGSVGAAAAVAQHLPAPVAGPLLTAARDAYAQGMAEVMLACAGILVLTALLVGLFLPARGPETSAADVEPAREGATV